MERVGYKAKDHEDAERYNIEQMRAMTVAERFEVAAILRNRYYGTDNPDMREAARQGHVKKTHRPIK